MSEEHYHKVIGIDLGTTYSAVSVYDNYEEDAIIVNNVDADTTPSAVSLDPTSRHAIVGRAAKVNLAMMPDETIVEIKREMGELFTRETLEKYNAGNIFTTNDPVRVRFADDWRLPQEISALILMKMQEIAQKFLREEILDAVVTVPAYFTERQKKATEEAALLAGLYPRQLIPEPTAAAICYGLDRMEDKKKTYLVYDLGGGTFDVSIIEVEGNSINVLATSGDPRLGGADFDDKITIWAVGELEREFAMTGLDKDPKALATIKLEAEQAKIRLSTFENTDLTLGALDEDKAPVLKLTRERFEEEIRPILTKSLTFVDKALQQAEKLHEVQKDSISAVLLVGGSSKIPLVKSMLLEHFGKEEEFVRSEVNTDTVVARGAAMMACAFEPTRPPFAIEKRNEATLMNPDFQDEVAVSLITEHTLGVGVQDKLVAPLIGQGSYLPIEKSDDSFTNGGPTRDIEVVVFQGESKYQMECTPIGTMHLGPMEPLPAGEHRFNVTFALDMNGLLDITVFHINENKNYKAQFDQVTGVGGDQALSVLHQKLKELYGISSFDPVDLEGIEPPSPPGDDGISPPPPPPPGDTQDGPAADPQAEEALQEPVKEPGAAASEETSTRPPVTEETAAPPADVEIPDEFKQIVRRSKKLLSKKSDAEDLAKALQEFLDGLAKGVDLDTLEELGDELADVFDDARAN